MDPTSICCEHGGGDYNKQEAYLFKKGYSCPEEDLIDISLYQGRQSCQ